MEKRNKFRSFFSFHIDVDKLLPATSAEKAEQEVMRESISFFKDGIRRLKKNKIAVTCMITILIIVLSAIFIPLIFPYKYDQPLGIKPGEPVDYTYANLAPLEYGLTEQARRDAGERVFPHLFGTDEMGRDYFIRIIYGTRISLAVGLFASILVLIIGLIYGSISGYAGGKTDLFMMRVVDIIYSLPDMLMIILLSVALNPLLSNIGGIVASIGTNMVSIFIVFGLLYWVGMARLIRGQILSIKEQEYILAAKSIGASPFRIIVKHLIPNCIGVIIISTALQIPSAIFTESFLSFLGLGVEIPMPSLGSLASAGIQGIYSYPHQLIIPALTICLIVLSFNLLGDGLRDAFDPKLRN